MIIPLLHRKPVPVDRNEHRATTVALPGADWRFAADLNSCFLVTTEFIEAAREFPILFVRAGSDAEGRPAIAPIAVFGLKPRENLFVEADGRWRARYAPALLRQYPFCVARVDAERFAICVDAEWPGLAAEGGQPLFDAAGEPAALLKSLQGPLEALEAQTDRTRDACRRIDELGLLQPMRFDATLPDGEKLTVDGFLTVDDKKLQALDAATVHELLGNGLLGLIHAHLLSIGHVRKLLDWHVERLPAAAAAAPSATA